MALKLYNTLTRQLEEFTPSPPYEVKMYNCGPTVYNRAHIGNIRAFLLADTLRRTLSFFGYDVRQVMNITDVDDKTIRGSQAASQSLLKFTRMYEEIFLKDLEKMNILRPMISPRATEHIPEMIAMIEKLLAKGFAYKADDGIYFDVLKSKNYGALAQLQKRTDTRSRIKNDEYDKENIQDFALWKLYTPEDGDVVWDAPFGRGRPGWHIECSAMATKYLGETVDIHTGGIDLIFPHHTNEIAQSEGCTEKQFVRYFVHNGFINVSDEKMSKSKRNFFTIEDIEEKNISPLAYRYWLLTAHYRTQVNLTWEVLQSAEDALKKLRRQISKLTQYAGVPNKDYLLRLTDALSEDLNTAQATALLWELIKDANINPEDKRATFEKIDAVLGLKLLEYVPEEVIITPELQKLLDVRKTARDKKDFAESDRLRNEIKKLGFEVKDTPEGQQLEKI